jgi:hypothetical protein
MTKSRRIRWVESVARMNDIRNVYKILFKKHLEGSSVDWRATLIWILKKYGVGCGLDSTGL